MYRAELIAKVECWPDVNFDRVKAVARGIGEFLVQGLQMRRGIWEPNFSRAIEKLVAAEVLAAADGESLRNSYQFLRASELVLRRWQNRSVSRLPATREEEDVFARRMKFASVEEFRLPYGHAREAIHSLRTRYLVD